MRTFILCVERYIHFPPEIYRLLATFLYYKQHWPDVNIRQYNKVMKQLPFPMQSSLPRIITVNDEPGYKPWRWCEFHYDIPMKKRMAITGRCSRPFRSYIRITEYVPLNHCTYVDGISASDFKIIFDHRISTGQWKFEFDLVENDREGGWLMIGNGVQIHRQDQTWLQKIGRRMKQEYQNRLEYFKHPAVKQIKYF